MNLRKPEWLMTKGLPARNWDPVIGCNRNCPECIIKRLGDALLISAYENEKSGQMRIMTAIDRDIYNRFYGDIEALKAFRPTLLWTRYHFKFPEQPAFILVNAVSDIHYWHTLWMDKVIEKIKKFPQHKFFFLTKNINTCNQYCFPPNCWLGVVVDNAARLHAYETVYSYQLVSGVFRSPDNLFIIIKSIDAIQVSPVYYMAKWLIFSAENQQSIQNVRENEDTGSVVRHYHRTIPVFMETGFKSIWKDKLLREFPDFNKL